MKRNAFRAKFVAVPLALSLAVGALLLPAPVRAYQGAPAETGATLLQQAKRLEAAGKYKQAGDAYGKAAAAFEREKNSDANINALEKSAEMLEKYAEQLLKGAKERAQAESADREAARGRSPRRSCRQSARRHAAAAGKLPLVNAGFKGGPVVAAKNQRAITGVKLSRHDTDIHNPSMVVTPDGTIHVAFVEQKATTPFEYSVSTVRARTGARVGPTPRTSPK